MHMISLQDSVKLGDEIQGDAITTKHMLPCTTMVDTIVHPGY